MTLSMYQASIPVFTHALNNLTDIIGKAQTYAEARNIDPSALTNARLFPDMLPLSRQIQIACDIVKGGAARLAGIEVPSFADTETTFAELKTRIEKTLAFIKTTKAEQIDGSETKKITIKSGGKDVNFEGQAYLLHFVLPNLFFHSSIAYAILRHNGLEIGKKDFLGSIQ